MKKCLSMALLLLALLLQASAMAKLTPEALPTGVTLAASVEGITEYQMKNGLRVLLAPDPSKPTITVNTTYLVGSKHENYGETGMAHLLEHLIFKGTPTYPMAFAEMQKRGMRMNGTTWVDRTNYFASFAANEADLDWYLRWSADAMVNSFIAKKDLDSEMTVVRNEMEMGENDPFRSLYGKALAAAYRWHNYGKDTIGARADVENVSIERLQAFYRKYYQPDNAVLVVTGKFDEAKTLKLINETAGAIARPGRKLDTHYTLDAAQDGETTVTVRRVGDTQIVLAMYHTPPAAGADFAALRVLAQILGDTPSGRLHKALVENKLAAAVFACPFQTREPGILTFGAQLP
ncbi:MAG: insulinase family protein, partial [Burkholderiales bacterium]